MPRKLPVQHPGGMNNAIFWSVVVGTAIAIAVVDICISRELHISAAMFSTIGAVYILPTAMAVSVRHKRVDAIVATNLLAGWTGLGWIAAMIWAFKK